LDFKEKSTGGNPATPEEWLSTLESWTRMFSDEALIVRVEPKKAIVFIDPFWIVYQHILPLLFPAKDGKVQVSFKPNGIASAVKEAKRWMKYNNETLDNTKLVTPKLIFKALETKKEYIEAVPSKELFDELDTYVGDGNNVIVKQKDNTAYLEHSAHEKPTNFFVYEGDITELIEQIKQYGIMVKVKEGE